MLLKVMPRRNRRDQPQIPQFHVAGFEVVKDRVEKPRDERTLKYDKFGEPDVRKRYLEVGIGRVVTEKSKLAILEATGLSAHAIQGAGIIYARGADIASKINFGLTGQGRLDPEQAIEDTISQRMDSRDSEVDTITASCRTMAVKRYGTENLKLVASVADIADEFGNPTMFSERIGWMEYFDLNQMPTMRPFDEVRLSADIALTDEYSFDVAKRIMKAGLIRNFPIDIELEPVGPVTTLLPVYK